MIKRTFGQMKAALARVTGQAGMNMSDARVRDRFNEATEELMNEGDWPGVVDRYQFRVMDGNIILPYFLDRILGVAVNNTAYSMRSPWYEFVEYGPGLQSQCHWIDAVIDRDEWPIQAPIPCGTSWTLFTRCEHDERVDGVRPTLTVRGRLGNGREVRTNAGTAWIDGETLELNGDTDPYTFAGTAVFSEITSVVKPETNGYVELWANDGVTVEQLASYAPGETNPSYHAYFLPTLSREIECCCRVGDSNASPREAIVLVRARRRFIPVNDDGDIAIISNVPAMKAMMMAVAHKDTNKWQEYNAYKSTASEIMRKEAISYRGKIKGPVLTFSRGTNFGHFENLR